MPLTSPSNNYIVGLSKQTNEATVNTVEEYGAPVFSGTPMPLEGVDRIAVTDAAAIDGDPFKLGDQHWEATNQPRTIDYPFTIIQMQLDQNGKGTGTMSYATKVEANDDVILLEDYASTPFRLTNIEAKKSGK